MQDWIQRTYARTGVDLRGAEIVLEGGELIVQKGAETAVFTGDPAWMLEHVLEIVEKDGQTVLHFGDRSFVLTGVVGPNAAAQAEFSFTENGEACRIVVQYEVFDGESVLYCGRVYMDGKYYGFGQARGVKRVPEQGNAAAQKNKRERSGLPECLRRAASRLRAHAGHGKAGHPARNFPLAFSAGSGYTESRKSFGRPCPMKPLTPKFPKLLHGGDYNPEQWLRYPEVLKTDIELMKKAEINCVSVGIFSWAHLEPQEGVYEFDWLAEIIGNLYENGIYTVLATPSGAKPLWMSEKYEEIRRVQPSGLRELSGARHNHCYTSPVYREKVREMDRRLAERFANHPGVILWHLSNEYGGECYCPLCQAAFRDWLKAKYKTLDSLNHAWWTDFWSHTYTDWSQINAPAPHGEMNVHGLVLDWKRFVTHQTVDFMSMERDAVKSVNPEIPVTANLMGFYDGLDYFKFGPALDVVSWDNYPQWHTTDNTEIAVSSAMAHDVMRSVKHENFLLMESTPSMTNWTPVSMLKRPGMHLLSSMQAVAHGSNSVQYFQFRKSRGSCEKFHGAVVDHVGNSGPYDFVRTENTRVFKRRAAGGRGASGDERARRCVRHRGKAAGRHRVRRGKPLGARRCGRPAQQGQGRKVCGDAAEALPPVLGCGRAGRYRRYGRRHLGLQARGRPDALHVPRRL